MFQQNLLLILALLPFGGAVVAATLPKNARNAEAWLSGLVMVAGLLMLAALYPQVADGGRVLARIDWVPSLGLNLTFRIDGFAWLFMVLVQGIGFLVVLYARYWPCCTKPERDSHGGSSIVAGGHVQACPDPLSHLELVRLQRIAA